VNITTLLQNLTNAEDALLSARAAIINEIIARLGDVTPSQFAAVTGINRGNLYAMLSKGRWNAVVAVQSLLALDGIPSETPILPRPRERPPQLTEPAGIAP